MVERNPFRFHNGRVARTIDELIACCREDKAAAAHHLARDDFELWFTYMGYDYLAEWTAAIREEPDMRIRVELFTSLSPVLVFLQKSRERRLSFLLVGRTGVGKSSTINYFLGAEIAPVGDHVPVTASVVSYDTEIYGVPVRVTDTPGLCDGAKKNGEYLLDTRAAVEEKGLDCCWFVSTLVENRVRVDEIEALHDLTVAFGLKIWDQMVVVLTHADMFQAADAYIDRLEKRSRVLRERIGTTLVECGASADEAHRIAAGVPFVGVTNEHERTPSGERWLGELFQTTLERMPPLGAGSLLMATAERLSFTDGAAPAAKGNGRGSGKKKDNGKAKSKAPPAPSRPVPAVWSPPAPRAVQAAPRSSALEVRPKPKPPVLVGEIVNSAPPAPHKPREGFHEVHTVKAQPAVTVHQQIYIDNRGRFDKTVNQHIHQAVGADVREPSKSVLAIARVLDKGVKLMKGAVKAVVGWFF
ncbi:GTPase [Actinoplanes sp. CA-142083]|uniref:GTPase n=1 Tax=Actinoplanes sp. CA-142083 TaxID=3239903 RepID=UPI003D93D5A9